MKNLAEFIRNQWFIIGVSLAIFFSYLYPLLGADGGIMKPEFTIKFIGVSLIFLNSGLSIKSEDFGIAMSKFRLHTFIQAFTLILFPLTIKLISILLFKFSLFDDWIIQGLQIVSCMPPPVSSAVILTKAVGGDDASAIFNSAFGSFLGIFVSPILIYYSLGLTAQVPFLQIILTLAITVLIPLIVGQLLRYFWIQDTFDPYKDYFGNFSRVILLFIIYTTFCNTFLFGYVEKVSILDLCYIICFDLCIQISFLLLAFCVSNKEFFHFKRQDIVCILFCSTHKSLTLGIPILKVMFSSEDSGLYSIPLLVYQPMQILLGSSLVPSLKHWLEAGSKLEHEQTSDIIV